MRTFNVYSFGNFQICSSVIKYVCHVCCFPWLGVLWLEACTPSPVCTPHPFIWPPVSSLCVSWACFRWRGPREWDHTVPVLWLTSLQEMPSGSIRVVTSGWQRTCRSQTPSRGRTLTHNWALLFWGPGSVLRMLWPVWGRLFPVWIFLCPWGCPDTYSFSNFR